MYIFLIFKRSRWHEYEIHYIESKIPNQTSIIDYTTVKEYIIHVVWKKVFLYGTFSTFSMYKNIEIWFDFTPF